MKIYVIFTILFCSALLYAGMPAGWTDFQKDISIQAGQFINSPEHQAYRQQRGSRNYIVGDTKTFWRWNLAVMPPTWILTPATCRAVGEHSYIFVADSEWNNHMTQANVDSVMVRLELNTPNNPEEGAIQMDINLFGPIPDELDNDSRLIVFYSALGSFNGTQFDGYFSPYNQVTEAEAQQMNPPGHSNLCEMIYMTCNPLSPIAPIRLSVLAHELEHLIHWGQDADEESWIDEGCAELAMVAYGVPDPITSFNANSDNDLTAWNQSTADYVKVMLFFTYLNEHYDETGMIRDLIADLDNGITSLTNQVNLHYPEQTIGEILNNWALANTIDNPDIAGGLYNYAELALPNFTMTNVNQHPVMTNQTLQPYAADYIYYDLMWRPISFNITANNQVYISELILNSDQECIEVIEGGLAGEITFTIPDSAHSVVYVITNPNPAAVTYSYAAGIVSNEDPADTQIPGLSLNCYPNPFRSKLNQMEILLSGVKGTYPGYIEIYNIKGQRIRNLDIPKSTSNDIKINWDGKDKDNEAVSTGIYLLCYTNGKQNISKAVNLIK